MTLRRATLVPDTLLACNRGKRGAHTCTVTLDGVRLRAYVKPLTPEQLAAECFCGFLLARWDLNVPEPVLVEIAGQDWFCSPDAGYPDIKRQFGLETARSEDERTERLLAAFQTVCGFSQTPRALVCDEAIANCDRNLENILWDGGDPVWIDHERVFGLPGSSDDNHLARIVNLAGDAIKTQRAAVSVALTLARETVDAVEAELPHTRPFADFVRTRLTRLGNRVLDRFPAQQNDLFSPHT